MLENLIPLAYLTPYLAIAAWLLAMPSGTYPTTEAED
jgi:hypothetical protein